MATQGMPIPRQSLAHESGESHAAGCGTSATSARRCTGQGRRRVPTVGKRRGQIRSETRTSPSYVSIGSGGIFTDISSGRRKSNRNRIRRYCGVSRSGWRSWRSTKRNGAFSFFFLSLFPFQTCYFPFCCYFRSQLPPSFSTTVIACLSVAFLPGMTLDEITSWNTPKRQALLLSLFLQTPLRCIASIHTLHLFCHLRANTSDTWRMCWIGL